MSRKESNPEKVLDKKIEKGIVFYFIKWEGCDYSKCTWEPALNLRNINNLIEEYEYAAKIIRPPANVVKLSSKEEEENHIEFLRGNKPEKILQVKKSSTGLIVALVKFKPNSIGICSEDNYIPTYLLKEFFPQILIDYYETRIRYKV